MKKISEQEERKHKRRIYKLMDTVFADVEGDDCDVLGTITKAYIIGFKDCERRMMKNKK